MTASHVPGRLAPHHRIALLLALGVFGCGSSMDPEPIDRRGVRWLVPSVLAPTGSLINNVAATDSIYFVGGALELAAFRATDGTLLWKRGDVASRTPTTLGDSLVVMLGADGSAAMRQRDGTVVWQAGRVGTASSVTPVTDGRVGMFVDFDGNLFRTDLTTGATRRIATMPELTGGAGQIWNLIILADTVFVVSQRADSVRGVLWLSAVALADGRMLRSTALPTGPVDAVTTNPMGFLASGLLIADITGGLAAFDVRSATRVWIVRSINTGARFAIRDGKIYTGTGDGTILVLDGETGTIVRRLERLTAEIASVYPCREGILFSSGGMYRVADRTGAKVTTLAPVANDGGFTYFTRNSTTLFSSAASREIAIACS